MIIKFWGAARTVTGSMHLLELESGTKVLLDCGLYQGSEGFRDEYNRSFPCDPSEIDLLILSHAHIDHCGNIPQLVKAGFNGKIYATHATFDLVSLLLQDSAKIQEGDAKQENKWRKRRGLDPIEPIYGLKDVPAALDNFVTLPYGKTIDLTPDISLLFLDAGHMLGSATVNLTIREGKKVTRLGFTGDIGRPGSLILRDPQPMPQADILISESTYGGKSHESHGIAADRLLEIIQEACVERQGKLIIPAFSVGRTQVLIHTMDQLVTEGRMPRIPVFVDSPLAVNATDVFRMHPECYDEDLLTYMNEDPNPFGFSKLTYVRTVEQSKALNTRKGPFVVIASSGMMTAGRVLHHLAHSIADAANTILVVGYCAKGTLGSRIVNGASEVKIFGDRYKVKAQVKRLNAYSGHAGQDELHAYLAGCQDPDKLKRVFLVHGEEDRATLFQQHLEANGFRNVIVPHRSESFQV